MIICIEDFSLDVIIGILDSELHSPQTIVINMELEYDFDGSLFLNYVDMINETKEFFDKNRFGLLEDAIIGLMGHLKFKNQTIDRIKIQIFKPEIMPPIKISVKFEKFFAKP